MTKFISLFSACFLILSMSMQAQTTPKTNTKASSYSLPSRDYVMLQIGYENWLNAPDTLQIGGLGRSFNGYICYDFPISKSNFSFAAGLGVGVSNIYLKKQTIALTDTTTSVYFINSTTYKKYKLTTTYIEAPFELRYFSDKEDRNKGYKVSIGMKVGALISSHTKGKRTLNNKPIVEKVSTKRYIETWRYAATARIGWGNFSVYGQYQLSNLFRVNNGPENIRPYQIGICLSGL